VTQKYKIKLSLERYQPIWKLRINIRINPNIKLG